MATTSSIPQLRGAAPPALGGRLAPLLGFAAVGASAALMAGVAAVVPEAASLNAGQGSCAPLSLDFGCGHGWGCACHMRGLTVPAESSPRF